MKLFIYIKCVLLSMFISASFLTEAQDVVTIEDMIHVTDSLKNILATDSLDERQQLDMYNAITESYASHDPDSVIVYAPKAISLAEKLNSSAILHTSYCHLGTACCFKCKYEEAHKYLDKALQLALEMDNKLAEAKATSLVAFTFSHQGKYTTAISTYLKALAIYDNLDNPTNTVFILSSLAELNRKLGNMDIAIQYLDRSARLCEKLKGTGLLYAWRISHVYNEYTLFYLAENDIDKALEYALKCNEATSLYCLVITVCINRVLLAKIYLRLNDYETAMRYAGEAMEQANILKSDNLYVEVYNVLSDIYLAKGQYTEAEIEALKAWCVDSTNISESRTAVANIALSNIYMQNTDRAAHFFNKYVELNDLYSEKSFHITVSDLSIKYETEKKEIRIQSMKRQRLLFLIVSITGIMLSIVVWAVSLQKIRRMRMERRLVAVHAILEGENRERERVARDLHDGLNGMISSVKIRLASTKHIPHISEKLGKCIDEIHCMISDMNPSSLNRFGMKAALEDYCCRFPNVQFHFFGDDRRIDEKLELAVYACTYELVNNSIRHSGATVINVQLVQESTRVSLTVQDNGCGFDKKLVGEGSGLRNVNYRIIAFGGAINIVTSPGNGAETNIEFKIKNTLR